MNQSKLTAIKPQPNSKIQRKFPLSSIAIAVSLSFSHNVFSAEKTEDTKPKDKAIEKIEVIGSRIYLHQEGSSGTKMDMAVKDTPQAIKVITADVIKAASIKSFEDVYKVDASASSSHSIDSFPRNYFRGFATQGDSGIKVDGFRFTAQLNLDLVAYERFEVVKGPTSTLYGQTSVGGTINAVSKKPLQQFALDTNFSVGSNDTYRGEFDITGPMTDDGRLSYRFITAVEESKSFIDYVGNDLILLAPSIKYDISDDTNILIQVNYQEHDDRYHWGSPMKRVRAGSDEMEIADIPHSQFFGMPWNSAQRESLLTQIAVEHHFENSWKLRANTQLSNVKMDVHAFSPETIDHDGWLESASLYAEDSKTKVFSSEVNLFGEVEIFDEEDVLFFGADYSKSKDTGLSAWSALNSKSKNLSFNVFEPDYSENTVKSHTSLDDYDTIYNSESISKEYGATVQLLLNPTDKLRFTVGGRYSVSSNYYAENDGGSPSIAQALAAPMVAGKYNGKYKNFTTQTGLTYQLTDNVNFYASYGESFEPNRGRSYVSPGVTKPLEPEEGRNHEFGIKGDVGDGFSFSSSVYYMTRSNITESDRSNATSCNNCSITIGTQRTRGFEIDVFGNITDNLNIMGSMSLMDAEFVDGEYAGLRPSNAPKFGLSIFLNYAFDTTLLQGFGVRGGVVHKSGLSTFDTGLTVNNKPFTYKWKDYSEIDVGVYYETENWEFDLGVTNLTNVKYYSSAFSGLRWGVNPNAQRQVSASINYAF